MRALLCENADEPQEPERLIASSPAEGRHLEGLGLHESEQFQHAA